MSEDPMDQSEAQGRRVTIREIADEVGLHFTTVARALRDSQAVRPATKERILAVAERLGYRRDPFVSALCSYRSEQRQKGYRGNLTWINGFGSADFFETAPSGYYRECYEGAKQRCSELGYKLVSFWIGEPGMSAKRASQILLSRGELGLILAPMPQRIDELNMRWDAFASVRIGYSLPSVALPNVVSDHFGNMRLLCERLEGLGFRRIGFATRRWIDARVEHKWSGAFSGLRLSEGGRRYAPLFLGEEGEEFESFAAWYGECRPEVIILGGVTPYAAYLRRLGIRTPGEVQLVSVSLEASDASELAGVDQAARQVGAAAVDHLSNMIHRSLAGLKEMPMTMMTKGFWRPHPRCDPSLLEARREG